MTREGKKPPRRQVFVLTPEEKRAAACVIAAFLLGLGTMYYRAKHPRPPLPPTAKEQKEAKRAAAAERRARTSPARIRSLPTPKSDSQREAADDGEE